MSWIDGRLCVYEAQPWWCRIKLFVGAFVISTGALLLVYGEHACWWHRILG